VRFPTNGSFMILNASALKGALSDVLRVTSSPFGFTPLTSGTSSGPGRKSTTASRICWTPLFLKAVPRMTGKNFISRVPLRMPFTSSSFVSGWPSRYLRMRSSSTSATDSSSFARYSLA